MKNKIFTSLKKLRKNVIEYIITNRLFISYVILALFATMLVRHTTIGHFFSFKPIITDLGLILIIGGLGYFVKPKNQFKYYFFWIIFFNLISLISSIYYRFFTNFASIGELATVGQTETVTGSIFDKLQILDAAFIIIPIIFYLIHKKLSSNTYYYFIDKIEKGKKMVVSTILVGAFCLSYSLGVATNKDYSRLAKQWDRLYIVERFGIITYQFNDAIQFLTTRLNSMFGFEKAELAFHDYFEAKKEPSKNKYTNVLKGKNIVFVHMESMQTFLMDLEFNGREVTPNLNKLASEGMFFTNFYPQVSTGTSSDTEFTLLSGLMPAASGVVFISYYDRNYFTIPKFLSNAGYNTFSMHGNLPSMWNRNMVHPSFGYKDMYFRESFTFTKEDVINLGINDRLFFEQAIPILENVEANNKNYMGTIITLSNHSPFKIASAYSELDLTSHATITQEDGTTEEVANDYLSSKAIGEYIKSANYADVALGDFLNYINNSNAFNDTVFVFYGDHDAKLSRKEINYLYNLNPETGETYNETDEEYVNYDYYAHELNKKTPLIIWTKNQKLKSIFKGEVNYTMGMYNVAPTILNMFGLYNKYSIGEDIFDVKKNNLVVFPNGNILTNDLYYNNSTGEYSALTYNKKLKKLESVKDKKLKEEDIQALSAKGEERLEISNSIIVYDLLKNIDMNGE